MFSANLVHLLSSFDGYKSNPCCAKEGKQGKNMCLIFIPLLFPFELKIIQGLQHLNRSIEVSTMTSSKAASTVSLSGVCKNENRKWWLLFSIALLRFTINQEQMLFIQQYFVKVLLPWRKCETSLIKLEHMLMEEIILINPTFITYSSFFFKIRFFAFVTKFNLGWVLVIFPNSPDKETAHIVFMLHSLRGILRDTIQISSFFWSYF